MGDVIWETFSQSFGAWYLPWIALMFQIPFGAECMWNPDISFPFTTLIEGSQTLLRMSSIFS